MKAIPVGPLTLAVATVCVAVGGLLAGCGAVSTVTVTVPGSSAPAVSPSPAPTTPAAPSAPTEPAGCATAGLTGSLGSGGAAAGSSYFPIVFSNTSGSSCTLYGYPGVSFVSASGAQIGKAATEDPVYPRRLVTLAPGGTAHAELQITVAQNYPPAICSPVAAHRLKVFPPGQTAALYIAVTATACAKTSVQILAVQTVQPGAGGP
jgi:hypothetical protein